MDEHMIAPAQAQAAIDRLRAGNDEFLHTETNAGNTSEALVKRLSAEGQAPYACIVSCADSRVVPEHIFSAGLGELFCIRVAGNVIGAMELVSCAYAADHLHVPLIVVLGHTQCGAVGAAMAAPTGHAPADDDALAPLVAAISSAIAGTDDPREASIANVRASVAALEADPALRALEQDGRLAVMGALYLTESGEVEFL